MQLRAKCPTVPTLGWNGEIHELIALHSIPSHPTCNVGLRTSLT
jgi:hypothetical protein